MDKDLEHKILNKIFIEEDYIIEDSEEPDFILSSKKFSNIKFGVEITEFFRNQLNAKLQRAPGYLAKILNSDKVKTGISKKDLKKINIENITMLDKYNVVRGEVKGIVEKVLSKEDIDGKIYLTIKNKENKIENYQKNITENYLIIYDNEGILYGESSEKIYEYIVDEKLKKAIAKSRFREIYIITRSQKEETYSGLISLMFMNTFSSALAFANRFGSNLEEKIEYSFNILYNYGFRFKWGMINVKDNFIIDMKKEIQNRIDSKKTYVILYHDCLIKFSAFDTSNFCIIGKEELPLGLSLENTLGTNLLNYTGNYNLFMKINNNYNTYVRENEIRHYINSKPVKGLD